LFWLSCAGHSGLSRALFVEAKLLSEGILIPPNEKLAFIRCVCWLLRNVAFAHGFVQIFSSRTDGVLEGIPTVSRPLLRRAWGRERPRRGETVLQESCCIR